MTLEQIYRLAIKLGRENDLRPANVVQRHLDFVRKNFDKLTKEEQEDFDQDKLFNPYLDSRLFGDGQTEVKKVLVGIDLDTSEVLLADRLNQQGAKIDALIFHHPVGKALAEGLQDVMKLQVELLHTYGVPLNVAESLIKIRRVEVDRSTSAGNYYKALDAARLLNFPVLTAHTVADNMVATYLKNLIVKNQKNLVSVGEVMDLLKDIPEYKMAKVNGMGPTILVGAPDNYAGKIAITEITGGTEGSKHMYEKLAQAGVGTIIGMHLQESHREEAEKNHLNVIIAGHMSSDSIGLNLLLDQLANKGVEIVACSGFLRYSRLKKQVVSKKRPAKRLVKSRRRSK